MILEDIARAACIRVQKKKEQYPEKKMRDKAGMLEVKTGFPFEKALEKPGIAFICEVKKASPSKGVIAEDFPYIQIAREYQEAGAAAISVLTEPDFFQGSERYLHEIKKNVEIPVLRKDFIIDAYQLYESKVIGADAVLLICALLDTGTLQKYIRICDSLGLSALVEAHDADEVKKALKAEARIIGVNNRNLKDFTVDIHNSVRLREFIPEGISFVAESGIRTPEDMQLLYEARADAVLIGETLMCSPDKKGQLDVLRSGIL